MRLNIPSVVAIVGAFSLTACTTINPYTGEEQTSNAAVWGAGAAVVCGLIGAAESSKRARNAALGCGMVGAGIGAYMDVQEAKLRQELKNTGVSIKREGDRIRLIMPGNITFATNSSQINSDFYEALRGVGLVLKKYEDTTIRVIGHTDSTGSLSYNNELSEKRAKSVADYLNTKGVVWERIRVNGAGPSQPIADNGSAQGRERNRRVELTIEAKKAS